VWAEASRLGCGVVAERALLVVGRRLAAVAGEAQFLGLSREVLLELELERSDGLAVRSERAVYEAVSMFAEASLQPVEGCGAC
jgi:hypothetical protein